MHNCHCLFLYPYIFPSLNKYFLGSGMRVWGTEELRHACFCSGWILLVSVLAIQISSSRYQTWNRLGSWGHGHFPSNPPNLKIFQFKIWWRSPLYCLVEAYQNVVCLFSPLFLVQNKRIKCQFVSRHKMKSVRIVAGLVRSVAMRGRSGQTATSRHPGPDPYRQTGKWGH